MNAACPSLGRDVARLQNVFKKLAIRNHPLQDQALKLRDEISLGWLRLAERNEWFAWPSTSVSRGPANGRLRGFDWRTQGMLSFLGYHVGETQPVHPLIRESMLEFAFEHHLPPVGDATYFEEWSTPRSARRLQKLANTLASLTRNAKRRDPAALSRAIDEWERDLMFLYERYYLGLFRFGWPATEPFDA